jgi:hypothetical protein
MSYVPPSATTAAPIAGASTPINEGLALFITFGILGILATQKATAKFALWVGIALTALVWNNAIRSGKAKTFISLL